MIKNVFIAFLFLTPQILKGQHRFRIELEAPSYVGDSLLFSAPRIKVGLESLYTLQLDTNSNVSLFRMMAGKNNSVFQIKIQPKTVIEGSFLYPQPVAFQYYNKKTKEVYVTSTFYIDSGTYKISLPKLFHLYPVSIQSSVNQGYLELKKTFADLYSQTQDPTNFDAQENLESKQRRIGNFIQQQPNSYVAFWEIVSDYTMYGYNYHYLQNLNRFSDVVKGADIFSTFNNRLISENSTMKGDTFPNVTLGLQTQLSKNFFAKNKYTFIDFWSITCSPCIKSMPEISSMYATYKSKGANFISVTAEKEPEKKKIANSILERNRSTWTNYFDHFGEFSEKLGVTAYPLYLLVDQNGLIVEKSYGNLPQIKKKLSELLD